jgi:hypothetical protein
MESKRINLIEEFLSKDECNELIKHHKDGDILDSKYMYEKITKILNNNFKFKGHYLGELETITFKEYTPQKKYTLNWEINNESYFTIVIQLNDDFRNGYEQYLIDEDEKYFQSPKITGSLIFFFSNIKHRLAPVKTNSKYVLETEIKLLKNVNFKKTLI